MRDLLLNLQLEFENNGIIGPGIIRNYQGLPDKIYSNDIDIVAMKSEKNLIDDIFHVVSTRIGLKCIKYDSMYYTNKYLFRKGSEMLEIDVNFSFHWYGVQFFDIKQLYKNQHVRQGFIVLGTEEERVFITFCHSFLYGGFINQKYLDQFQKCMSSSYFHTLMRKIFLSDTPVLLDAISRNSNLLSRSKINFIRIKVILAYYINNFFGHFSNRAL